MAPGSLGFHPLPEEDAEASSLVTGRCSIATEAAVDRCTSCALRATPAVGESPFKTGGSDENQND